MGDHSFDYSKSEEKRALQSSHLKYHFRLKNIQSLNITNTELEDRILRELSNKFSFDFQCDSFKVQDIGKGKSEILMGFRFDRQAELIKSSEVYVRPIGTVRFEPTEAYYALLEFRTQRKVQRPRSRSPRNSAPMVLIVCPPKKVEDRDVVNELSRLGIIESPNIEHVFTNLNEYGDGHIIKLSFHHVRTIEKLTASEFSLKGKPVLLLQPSLKNDLEKSVNHAIVHHQVLVDANEFSAEEVSEVMNQFGRVCQIDRKKGRFLVTFTQFQSAKLAIKSEFISIRDYKLAITKNSI